MAGHDPLRLQRVLRKYRLLLELRVERDEVERSGRGRFPPAEVSARRLRLKRLAEEYPGSLRELDASTASRLGGRAELLDAALRHRAPEPEWVHTVDDFHLALRRALAIKRWLVDRMGTQRALDDRLARDFNHEHPDLDHRFTLVELRGYLRPPGGRLLNLVWAELDERLGRTRADLERDVYG